MARYGEMWGDMGPGGQGRAGLRCARTGRWRLLAALEWAREAAVWVKQQRQRQQQ